MEVECLALKDLNTPRKSVGLEEDGSENEQKENICTDRRRSTPLKAESILPALLLSRKAVAAMPDLAHITPIKRADRLGLAEPWTPTANLKMLISAASPDIREREMRKVLFRPIENERETPVGHETTTAEDTEVEDSCQFEAAEEEDEEERKPSRKQKSLGLLCQKFLALYPDYPPAHSPIWISLDEVATNLGVERRRIYDIVNVLESLMIVGRIAKNCYTWHGRQRLAATLEELQRDARQQGYHRYMELAAVAPLAPPTNDAGEGDAANAASNRKDKSLRIMSQKFVMLFLVSRTQTVTLDVAAKILIEESQDSSSHSKYKTKVRRLYDIANVLTSLGLIKKVHVREERGRKPAFQWLGPVHFSSTGNDGDILDVASVAPAGREVRKLKLARHASFNVTPTSVAIQRQVSSAPSSPRREHTALPHQPVDYSRKTSNNSAVCRLQFVNTTDGRPSAGPQTHSSPLPPSSNLPTLLVPPLHPEDPFTSSSSSHQHPHRLAYLPSLSQPSVVMLYGPPLPAALPDKPDRISEGQRSPKEGRKRKRGAEGEEETGVKKRESSGAEERDKTAAEAPREAGDHSPVSLSRDAADLAQPSHYLYVPNSAGLNSLNFLLSAGHSPAGLALPPGSVPTLALPYVLVPSAALSHYPVMTGGLQQQGSDAHCNLSFSLPTMMSPAHFVMGAAPYSLAADVSRSPVPSSSTPEQTRRYGTAAGAPQTPSGPRQPVGITTPEPLTPNTPKETVAPASKAFFQTPGTLGSVVTTAPVARKRGSAQRRLDIGHPSAS
ncbi:transcription factor E2F7 [Diretmus argenteus]